MSWSVNQRYVDTIARSVGGWRLAVGSLFGGAVRSARNTPTGTLCVGSSLQQYGRMYGWSTNHP